MLDDLEYQQRFAYSGSGLQVAVQYIGYAHPGAADGDDLWVIKKYVYDDSGNVVSIMFADDSKAFDKRWTKRHQYSYR